MAFPQIAASQLSTRANNNTADVCGLNTLSLQAEDLAILALFRDGAGTSTIPSPWVEMKDIVSGTGAGEFHLYVAYLIASGGETSVTVTSTVSERFTAIAIRITAASWHGSTPPEISTCASGDSLAPDPDAVTAPWGSADNLFIALACCNINGFVNGYPTNYSSNQIASDTTPSAAHGGIASRELAASSDDPGAFSLDASEQWLAGTIVVLPPAAAGQPASKRSLGSVSPMGARRIGRGWSGKIAIPSMAFTKHLTRERLAA